jgi:predicted O-methyltransferase YrrM
MTDDTETNLVMHACSFFNKPRVLELGTYKGITTNNLAKIVHALGGTIVTVDVKAKPNTLPEMQSNECLPEHEIGSLIESKFRPCIRQVLVDPATDYTDQLLPFGPYDVIFYDGDHSYEGIKKDLAITESMKADKCIQLLHDVWWDITPPPVDGPLRVMREYAGASILNFSHVGVLNFSSVITMLGVPDANA